MYNRSPTGDGFPQQFNYPAYIVRGVAERRDRGFDQLNPGGGRPDLFFRVFGIQFEN
jgi:hypothetical protein